MTAVISNKTKDIKNNYDMHLPFYLVAGEVHSRIECMGDHRMKGGDRIKISFKSFQDLPLGESTFGGDFSGSRVNVKVKKCGAHLILRTPSPPC